MYDSQERTLKLFLGEPLRIDRKYIPRFRYEENKKTTGYIYQSSRIDHAVNDALRELGYKIDVIDNAIFVVY